MMYYMGSISTYDQQVHKCLWRNLEIGREPHTYIKTALKFGDRPSPAMPIVALRKTAKLKEKDTCILKVARTTMTKRGKNTRYD